MSYFLRSAVSFILILFAASAPAQLEKAFDAHGGLAKWRSYGSVEFDLAWSMGGSVKKDHHLFDLRSRDGLITSDEYTLGAKGGEVWIKPSIDALGGTPPRFYIWTPFYFFVMPFVFADPGVVLEPIGRKTFQDREYDAVKITFKPGTGDSPDDYYVVYLDPASGQLRLVSYIVTYAPLRKGKPMDQLEPHVLVFDEWQEAGGLRVLKRGTLYNWVNENIAGEPLGVMEFSKVKFAEKTPEPAKFAKPADAVIAPLE